MKLCKACAQEAKAMLERYDTGLVASYLGDAVKEALSEPAPKAKKGKPADAAVEGAEA